MGGYLLRRLVGLLPVLLGITVLSFAVMKLAPGEPTDAALQFNPRASVEARERIEKLLGLDQPLPVQYVRWLGRLVRLDFGRSFLDGRPVAEKVAERLPVTLGINAAAIVLVFLLAIPLGVVSAARPGGAFDRLTTLLVFIGYAMPSFWLALLGLSLFGVHLRWLPVTGLHSLDAEAWAWPARWWDTARHLALPVGIMTFTGLAGLSRYVRTSMRDVLEQDYIRTARAKGLSERRVLFHHGLRNGLLPMVTLLGLMLPSFISGSVIMETIFAIPGMGRLFFEAVMARDDAVVMALVTVGGVLTLAGNLLADLAYAWADPRIRVGRPA
jgi:peptide/nickel transport system permease protein